MRGVFSCFLVKGLNLSSFLNLLQKRGITLKNVKILSKNTLSFWAKNIEREKIFAISDELCYNIKVIKERGVLYPLLFLKRNIGLAIGAIIFLALVTISNNYVFNISYYGSGSAYKNEVSKFLALNGVKRFSRFSDLDLDKLAKEVLASNESLSFVSCQKRGNTLRIELASLTHSTPSLDGNVTSIVSDVNGVIADLKVYRGFALKNKGDSVKIGEELVTGTKTVDDKVINTNVIAVITVICEGKFTFISNSDDSEETALLFAQEKFSDKEIFDSKTEKFFDGKRYIYNVTCYYKHTIYKG